MILNTKEDWQPPEKLYAKWIIAYPKVDVQQELNKMEVWCDSNPTKRKTKGGISKFCNSWLSRCQDQGGSSPSSFQSRPANKEMRLRDIPLDASLTDVSWIDDPSERKMAIDYYLATRGFYFDGKEMQNAC